MFLIVIKAELAYTEHYYNNADEMQSKFLHCILSFSYNTPALVTSEGRPGQKLMAITVFVCYTRKEGVSQPGFPGKRPFQLSVRTNPSNRSIFLRTISRLERQKVGERTSMPKRAASVAASARPVEESRSS